MHALLGENGAGKTTLMRIAYGLEIPDRGEIEVGSESRTASRERLASPREARALGIGMVHQHFTSIPAFTVAENVALAAGWRETGRRAMSRAREVIDRLGLPLDPGAVTRDLSVQLRQRLEIVQALAAEARVLLLDEPTAVLAPPEVAELVNVIRRFAAQGGAVVLITHKLREVALVADRVTVLRDGRVALTGSVGAFDPRALSAAMIGDDPALAETRRVSDTAEHEPRISIAPADQEPIVLRAGEIVGVAAVEGNGQRELLRAIAGVDSSPPGLSLTVSGSVAFIPEDRTTEALIGEFTLVENQALGHLDRLPRWLDWGAIARDADAVIRDHDVRTTGSAVAAATLSGGNQQKFVLGRALGRDPEIVIAENPTRGLDIRATGAVHGRLREAAGRGACVLVHSSDLDEVIALADRLLVMHAGVLQELPRVASRSAIGDAMLGLSREPR